MSNSAAPTIGTIALGLAVLLTLVTAGVTKLYTMKPPSGSDAMGLVVIFFVLIVAWLLTLVAAFIAVRRGAFDWVSGTPAVPTLAVLATAVGLGALSVVAAGMGLEARTGAWRTPIGLAGAFLLPLAVQGFVAALLWTAPSVLAARSWPKAVGWPLLVLAFATAGWGVVAWVQSENARARARQEQESEWEKSRLEEAERQRRHDAEQDAALDALPDDAPLEQFLSHLFIDTGAAHHALAVERIRKLPDLTRRLEARLSDPLPLEREHAANFVGLCDPADPAWAPAIRKAILLLADDYRADAKDPSRGHITHVKGLTWGILLAAERFREDRFDAEARTLRSALEAWPRGGERDEAIGLVDDYLARRPLPR